MSADVIVVGLGPVGQLTTALLAQYGRRVTVIERFPQPYPMPRAVSYDGESARILAAAGVADAIAGVTELSRDYRWENGSGELLFEVSVTESGHSGWPDFTSVYQPGLEAALIERAAGLPGVRVLRGHEVVGVRDEGESVEVTVRRPDGSEERLQAGWLVGCDGANSIVRSAVGARWTDLGFADDWLTCDVELHEPRTFHPNNLQVCDPGRPRTAVSAGPGHRRWEFMRLPGEPVEEFGTPGNVWRLLALFGVTPGNATLLRHSVYTFRACYADRWRSGRLLLAGDAAHLMPPFAGQGMSSGFRDAANLAWKLDAVIRGVAGERLLDTYGEERGAHVQHAIDVSVNLGRVICQTDPKLARDRDEVMLASRRRGLTGPPPTAVRPLAGGFVRRGNLKAGALIPQGRVAAGSRMARFDDLVPPGLLLLTPRPAAAVTGEPGFDLLRSLGVRVVPVVAPGSPGEGLVDIDGSYLPYLEGRDVLVRPDFYVYGSTEAGGLAELAADLRSALGAERRHSAATS